MRINWSVRDADLIAAHTHINQRFGLGKGYCWAIVNTLLGSQNIPESERRLFKHTTVAVRLTNLRKLPNNGGLQAPMVPAVGTQSSDWDSDLLHTRVIELYNETYPLYWAGEGTGRDMSMGYVKAMVHRLQTENPGLNIKREGLQKKLARLRDSGELEAQRG